MKEATDVLTRQMYMDRINPYIGRNIIKILTGQRRVGKSHILKAVSEEIRHTSPEAIPACCPRKSHRTWLVETYRFMTTILGPRDMTLRSV